MENFIKFDSYNLKDNSDSLAVQEGEWKEKQRAKLSAGVRKKKNPNG